MEDPETLPDGFLARELSFQDDEGVGQSPSPWQFEIEIDGHGVGPIGQGRLDHGFHVVDMDIVIRVHKTNPVPPGQGESLIAGRADPLVFLAEKPEPAVPGLVFPEYGLGGIGRSIGDGDDLNPSVGLGQDGVQAAPDPSFGVVYRNYNADKWVVQAVCPSLGPRLCEGSV